MEVVYTFTGSKRVWPLFHFIANIVSTIIIWLAIIILVSSFSYMFTFGYSKLVKVDSSNIYAIAVLVCAFSVSGFATLVVGILIAVLARKHWDAWRHSERYSVVVTKQAIVITTWKRYIVPWDSISEVICTTLPRPPGVSLVLKRKSTGVVGYRKAWYEFRSQIDIPDVFEPGFSETMKQSFAKYAHASI